MKKPQGGTNRPVLFPGRVALFFASLIYLGVASAAPFLSF